MRRFLKHLSFTLLILVILGIGFSFLEPLTQAKIFLRVAGIHDQNKQLDGFKNLLLDNSYTKYSSLDEMPDAYKQKLKRYLLSRYSETPDTLNLHKVYAAEGEEWEPTDNITDASLPRMQFRYAYCSDRAMILIVKVGGFAVTTSYEVFEIEDGTLIKKNSLSYYYDNIFDLSLGLRFTYVYDFMDRPDSVLPED